MAASREEKWYPTTLRVIFSRTCIQTGTCKKKPPNPKFFTWEICTLFFAHFPCANSLCIPSALEESFLLIKKTGVLHGLRRISSIRKFTMQVYDNSMAVVKEIYRTENILKNDAILMARHLKTE